MYFILNNTTTLIIGFGASFIYMSAVLANVKNFLPEHRGKVVGLLDTMYGLGPAVYAILYSSFFAGGHYSDPENQNLTGFILMYGVSNGVSNILCVFVLREVPPEKDECYTEINDADDGKSTNSTSSYLSITDSSHCACVSGFDVVKSTSVKSSKIGQMPSTFMKSFLATKWIIFYQLIIQYIKVLLSIDYQILFWTFIIIASTSGMVYNNIGVVLKSYHLSKHQTLFTVVISAVGLPARFVVSVLSDWFKSTVPRSINLVLASLLNLVCHIVCLIYADSFPVLISVTILTGIVTGMIWVIAPTIVSEMFDLEHFGLNYGVCLFGYSMLLTFLQWVFGAVFDSHSTPGTIDCTGNICTRDTMIVSSCLDMVALVTSIVLFVRTRRAM